MNSSCTTTSIPGDVSGDHTGANARSASATDGSPTAANANPPRRTARPAEPGPANSTSCPAAAAARANGISGPT